MCVNHWTRTVRVSAALLLAVFAAALTGPALVFAEDGPGFYMTEAEREYAASAGTLKVSYNSSWMPFEYTDDNQRFAGIIADIFRRVSERAGLKFEYVATNDPGGVGADADIAASFEYDPEAAAEKGFWLTKPYMRLPVVTVRRQKSAANGGGLTRTAVPEYYYSYKRLDAGGQYDFMPLSTAKECIDAVVTGKADQAFLNFVYVEHMKRKARYRNLISVAVGGVLFSPCIAVRTDQSPLLVAILTRALGGISDYEMNGIIVRNTMKMQTISLSSVAEAMPAEVASIASVFLLSIVVILLMLVRNRTRYIKEIKRILYTDELTGALSLAGFEDAVKKLLAANGSGRYYIIDFDISRFENYNALHGVQSGDKLLRLMAGVLRSKDLSADEPFARIYADHFAAISENRDADEVRERINRFDERFKALAEVDTSIHISYGVYEITDASMPVRMMTDCAEMAKKRVKGSAGNFIGFYDQELRQRSNEDGAMLAGMDAAIKNGEFIAFYQPKYSCAEKKITCAEALVRWRRNGALVPPDRFIGLFESNGQIARLDFYMLEQVCVKQREFADKGLDPVTVAVNFSRSHLYDASFVGDMIETTKKYGVPPSLIEIEFTERAMTEDLSTMQGCLQSLRSAGFSIAMDDFGSGYSSLNALKELPIDVVKLDKGFMDFDRETDGVKGRKVVRGVIDLAKQLSLKTVAEGVETKEQFEFLRGCGCDMIQGYYFSKPVDSAEYERLLSEQQKSARR